MQQVALWSILVHPLWTFDSLCERPRWFYPALMSGMISAGVNLYVIQRIGLIRLIEMTLNAKAVIDPQPIVQSAAEHMIQTVCFQAVAMLISSFVIAIATATVLWLLLTLCGYDMTLRQGLAVVAHVNLVSVALRQCIIVLVISLIQDPGQYDFNNPLATNPAFFVKPASTVTAKLLSALDLITFINIALLTTGLSRVCHALSARTALVFVVIPWIIYVGATAAL